MTRRYLRQENDFCCFLYALCNARRFLQGESPEPGTPEWERLVDVIGCRHGAAIDVDEAATVLGLSLDLVLPGDGIEAPAILTVKNPCVGTSLHACLFVGRGKLPMWDLVGYRTDGPVTEAVDATTVRFPGPPNHRHYNVRSFE